MTESTELSKAFAKQGLKIPIRNDGKIKDSDMISFRTINLPFNLSVRARKAD